MTTRRKFLKKTLAGSAAFFIVPRHVLGRGFTAPSDKLGIAAIGIGGRGTSNLMNSFASNGANIVALCDVSGSVANVSRFFLMFLHSLTDVLPHVRTFAFSNKAGEVTDLFESKDIEVAATETLLINGGGSTDYGKAFSDLEGFLENDIDRKTTVIILGDARSNYGDPRCDILKTIQEKSKRVIFLNPEPKSLWGTGDSEMLRFVPYTSKSKVCSSLVDLERVVDDMLRSSI